VCVFAVRVLRASWKNQIPLFSCRLPTVQSSPLLTVRRVWTVCGLCFRVLRVLAIVVVACATCNSNPLTPHHCHECCPHALAAAVAVVVTVAATHPTDTFACDFEFVFNSATSCYGCRRVISVISDRQERAQSNILSYFIYLP